MDRRALAKTNEISCWHAKLHVLTKNHVSCDFATGGLSSGAIVGIVLSVLAIIAVVGLVAFFDYRRNKYPTDDEETLTKTGFENILYSPGSENVTMETNEAAESEPDSAEA